MRFEVRAGILFLATYVTSINGLSVLQKENYNDLSTHIPVKREVEEKQNRKVVFYKTEMPEEENNRKVENKFEGLDERNDLDFVELETLAKELDKNSEEKNEWKEFLDTLDKAEKLINVRNIEKIWKMVQNRFEDAAEWLKVKLREKYLKLILNAHQKIDEEFDNELLKAALRVKNVFKFKEEEEQPSGDPTTTSPDETHGCRVDKGFFKNGERVPSPFTDPCVHCYCIKMSISCSTESCPLNDSKNETSGCRPVYEKGVCCPVKFNCPENTTPQ